MKKNTRNALYVLGIIFLSSLSIISCGSDEPKDKMENASGLVLAELLDRDTSLSLEEFQKIKENYTKSKTLFYKDNSDFKSLLKIVEIFVYEARVTGEHPHYYSAALKALDWMLDRKQTLTKDQLYTTLFYKATVQLAQHNFNEALVTGNEALNINAYDAGIYGVLVDANVEIGNYEEAVVMVDRMLQVRPDLRSYSRQSYLREIYGDIVGAKAVMVQAINNGDPASEYTCWAVKTLGEIHESQGDLDSAILCYDLTLKLRPNYPFGIAGIARVNAKKGNNEEAYKLYKEAIAIVPEIGFNIEVAKLKKEDGLTDESEAMIKEIETMFQEDIESGHNMNLEYAAFLAELKGEYDEALVLAKKELALRPTNIDVNKTLAFIYYAKGDMEKAKEHVKIALATNKKDADLLYLSGELNKNQEQIKQSLKLNPYQSHLAIKKDRAKVL